MTTDEITFVHDLLERLIKGEAIATIVPDIPYSVLDEFNNDCLNWHDVDHILTLLVTTIRMLLKEDDMNRINDERLSE